MKHLECSFLFMVGTPFSGTDPSEVSEKLQVHNVVKTEFRKPVNGDRLYESHRLFFNIISYSQTIT